MLLLITWRFQNGFKLGFVMPTITLKNIPDQIYESLKQSAEAHHRSINSEAISCLERVLLPCKSANQDRLERARQIRAGLAHQHFQASDISEAIEQGRP